MKDKIEIILNFIKVFLLFYIMVNGFYLVYAVIWFTVGLPQTNWAMWVIYAIACLTEYGYYRWIRSDNNAR